MNLNIKNQKFLVCGASSGFGRSVTEVLVSEGALVTAIARSRDKLEALKTLCPDQVEIFAGDLARPGTVDEFFSMPGNRDFQGAFINAGGPPALTFLESTIDDWDEAYRLLLRWKTAMARHLVEQMSPRGYGRLLFLESVTVKQPAEALVLSNSLRLAVVGFVKTLSLETAASGITMNVLAPGYHNTPAMLRIYKKRSKTRGITEEQAKHEYTSSIPSGTLGNPDNLATLAAWLLSPQSAFITGQTISVDGGIIRGVFG